MSRKPVWIVAALVIATGCAGGGSGSGSGSTPSAAATGTATAGATATNQPQWQTAMAALAQAPTPDPVRLDPAGLAVYNQLIASTWPRLLPLVHDVINRQVQAFVGKGQGGLQLLGVRNLMVDLAAAPAAAARGTHPFEQIEVELPAKPSAWNVTFTADVGGTFHYQLFGSWQQLPVHTAIDVSVTNIRADGAGLLDLRDPARPDLLGSNAPQVQLTLALTSPTPILSTIAPVVTQIIDPLLRAAFQVGAVYAQQQIGLLIQSQIPQAVWGRGGPAQQPHPAATQNLEALANDLSDEQQRDHTPFGQLYVPVYDSPTGTTLVSYHHHGDSITWSGHLLAAEAYRYDVNQSPAALAAADKLVGGIYNALHIYDAPVEGLLARCAIPLTSPHLNVIQGGGGTTYFEGTINGVRHGGLGATSRDAYTGIMFGLGQTHYRVPALRSRTAPLVDRALTHLESRDWVVYRADGVTTSVFFVQAPAQVLNFSLIGATTNPAKWTPMLQRHAPLSEVLWLYSWFSALEVHESYYKFNLGHVNLLGLCELETDPGRYRGYLKSLRTLRDTVAHHQNAWFDSIWGSCVPTQATAMGPEVEMGLGRWSLRPRRGFTSSLRTDPTIPTTTYTISSPNAGGSPTSGFTTGVRTYDVAATAIPVEKRVTSGYLWTTSPFRLDGYVYPKEQHNAVDMVLPYWHARSHGIIR